MGMAGELLTGDRARQDLESDLPVGVDASAQFALPDLHGPCREDSDLIDGVRGGDPSAMALLYDRYHDQALKFALAMVAQPQDAEDVLHEAFAKTVSAIRNGSGPGQRFGAYLSTAVRSVVNSTLTKQTREQPTAFENVTEIAVDDPALETALSVLEHEVIAALMRELPERWRVVLWHGDVMGLRPREISPLLGIEANAVSALLIRARAGLRAAYQRRTQHFSSNSRHLADSFRRHP